MRRGFVKSSRYSPGNMDRDSLEHLFVGRQAAMDEVVDRIVHSVDSANKHYILLVGPRGSGKTHFVAVAMHRVLDALAVGDASNRAVFAVLNEEEWGVASYLDFVVRILRALATRTPELGQAVERVYERFRIDARESEELAESLLDEHLAGRTLVVFCENLGDLFDGLGLEGQRRLRAHMQENGLWTVLATTPALFAGVAHQSEPFYGFFTVRHLEELDFETASELLVKKAVHAGKRELAEFLGTSAGRARTRAIHHLAGGNHRAYIVLFDFLDRQSLDDLITPFMHMVDALTPYYQDRMRQLAPAQRKIVEFLAQVSSAVQVKDVAAGCLMSQQTAAKQIGELAGLGFVRRVRLGRSTFCELAEPLMRICIEVKDNRSEHFGLFVEFLRHWFSNRELESRFSQLEHEHAREVDRLHLEEAVRNLHADRAEPFMEALDKEAEKCLANGDYIGLAAVQERLVRDRALAVDYHWHVVSLQEAGELESAISVGLEGTEKHPEDGTLQFDLAHAYWLARLASTRGDQEQSPPPCQMQPACEHQRRSRNLEDRESEALKAIDRAISLEPENLGHGSLRTEILLGLDRYDEAFEAAGNRLARESGHWQSVLQQVRALAASGRNREAVARADALVELAPEEPQALLAAADAHHSDDDFEGALRLVDAALAMEPDGLGAHHLRGVVHMDLGWYREASEELRYVVGQRPDSVPGHCQLSSALLYLGDHEEALRVAGRLIELDPGHGHAYAVRGKCLIELGRVGEAVAAFDQTMDLDDSHALLLAASELVSIGHTEAAGRYLDRAAQMDPDHPGLWEERVRLCTEVGDYEGAIDSGRKLESLSEDPRLARLLVVPAMAARAPLYEVFARVVESGAVDIRSAGEPFGKALAVSVESFGPKHLVRGVAKALELVGDAADGGVPGSMLSVFLFESDGVFAGQLQEWETALGGLERALGERADCRVPMEMLTAAVMYTKTGDERHLLSLPLEGRSLLEELLADAAPASTDSTD